MSAKSYFLVQGFQQNYSFYGSKTNSRRECSSTPKKQNIVISEQQQSLSYHLEDSMHFQKSLQEMPAPDPRYQKFMRNLHRHQDPTFLKITQRQPPPFFDALDRNMSLDLKPNKHNINPQMSLSRIVPQKEKINIENNQQMGMDSKNNGTHYLSPRNNRRSNFSRYGENVMKNKSLVQQFVYEKQQPQFNIINCYPQQRRRLKQFPRLTLEDRINEALPVNHKKKSENQEIEAPDRERQQNN